MTTDEDLKKMERLDNATSELVESLAREIIKCEINISNLPASLLTHAFREAYKVIAITHNELFDPVAAATYGQAFLSNFENLKKDVEKMVNDCHETMKKYNITEIKPENMIQTMNITMDDLKNYNKD